MFLRKLFKLDNKLTWILIDLVIVIIGVYCAFLIQNFAEQQRNDKEKEKVLTALKMELETFRLQMPEFADYMVNYLKSNEGKVDMDFSGWRYIEPQYAYQIVEYAINMENTEIVVFELYNKLQKLFVRIKQLEHVERLITHYSGLYKLMIPELSPDHLANLERKADNASNFQYFALYMRSRPGGLTDVAKISTETLEIIDEELGHERAKEIERDFLVQNVQRIKTEEQAVQMGAAHFPKFSEEEIRAIYREAMTQIEQSKK